MTENESGNILQEDQISAGSVSRFSFQKIALSALSSSVTEVSNFLATLIRGKVRLSICAGAFAGLLVVVGFFFFETTKEEWTLRQEYPRALNAVERHVLYSQDLFAEGESEKAERILTGVLKYSSRDGTRADALLLLAQILERSHDDDASAARARGLYQEFLSSYPLDPRVPTARLRLTENFSRNKYFIESNVELENLLETLRETDDKAEVQFLIARNFYEAGNFAQSAKLLKLISQEFPGASASLDADLLLGRIYLKLGKKEAAAKQFDSLVTEAPGTFHAALALQFLAQACLEEKAYSRTIGYCDQWLSSSPDGGGRANIMLLMGEARLGMNEAPRAFEAAQDIIIFFPDSSCGADAYILKGRALEALDRIEDAQAAYEEAIDRYPRNTQAFKEVARLHHMRGDLPEAIHLIEHVSSMDSEDDSARLELAKMYRENGENVKATGLLNGFIQKRQLSPQIGDAFFLLAQMQADTGQLDAAKRTLDRLLATGTTTVDEHLVFERQGDLLARAELYDDALGAYELAQENGAKSPVVSLKIAHMLFESGKADAFEKKAASIPQPSLEPGDRFELFHLYARARVKSKDFISARRYVYEAMALKTGKEKFSTLALLMQIDLALNDDAEAQKVYEVTRKLIPPQSTEAPADARQIVLDWAERLYGKQEYSKAADVYASLSKPCFPPSDVAWAICQEGNCHYKLADYAKAREAYSRLKQEFPNSEFAPFAARREKLLEQMARSSLRQA